ncbi:MAG: tetratricopeptide repeat protein [Candidatus Binatia bacterium]
MSSRFCAQCGASLLPGARFCTACGRRATAAGRGGGGSELLGRYAPALVVGAVLILGALTIGLAARSAAPPNVPPPRTQANAPGMPADHPPLEVPRDVREAIAKLVAKAKANPEDLAAWRQLGFIQYRAGQIDRTYLADAEATYQHLLARDPKDLDALRVLGNIAYDRDQPQQAMSFYRRYLSVKPDDLAVQTDLATMLLASRQVDAAVQGYRAVLQTDPNFFEAQFNLALAYRTAGDDAQALAALRRARDIATDADSRTRVETLLAHLAGTPVPGAAAPASGDLRTDVEAVFRAHPIAGPRVDRIEWPSATSLRVVLREFPMQGMPQPVRETFVRRIRSGLSESKARHHVDDALRVEIVDAGSGAVMEVITE